MEQSKKNKEFIIEYLAAVSGVAKSKLLQEATEIAIGDLGIIPLYHQVNVWAVRKGLAYKARTDERTYAFDLKPQ